MARRHFGTYLRKRREDTGMSLRKLAERAGLHYGLIFRVETGMSSPDLITIKRLARAFRETPIEFLSQYFGQKETTTKVVKSSNSRQPIEVVPTFQPPSEEETCNTESPLSI